MIAVDLGPKDGGTRAAGTVVARTADVRSAATGGWRPLAGAALLDRLRVTGRRRPVADPALAQHLREVMEAETRAGSTGGCGSGGGCGSSDRPSSGPVLGHRVVLTKDRLTALLAGEAPSDALAPRPFEPSAALVCGSLIDALFRQLVTVGSIGDPIADGLAALSVDERQCDLVRWIEGLPVPTFGELRAEVTRQADGLVRRWPPLDPAWLPRTQEALRATLCGGSVELSGRVDLAVGRPGGDEASVAIVEIKTGVRRLEHRADLHFYALIETLRRPAPPFVVATYYTRTGELDVDPVTDGLLLAAARRTRSGVEHLCATGAVACERKAASGARD